MASDVPFPLSSPARLGFAGTLMPPSACFSSLSSARISMFTSDHRPCAFVSANRRLAVVRNASTCPYGPGPALRVTQADGVAGDIRFSVDRATADRFRPAKRVRSPTTSLQPAGHGSRKSRRRRRRCRPCREAPGYLRQPYLPAPGPAQGRSQSTLPSPKGARA